MRASAHFGEKNLRFFKIYDVSAWTRGEKVSPMRTRGRGDQFFAIFCGRLLWKAP